MTPDAEIRDAARVLRELAEAATPGPWGWDDCEPKNQAEARVLGEFSTVFGEAKMFALLPGRREARQANAALIAAQDPTFALAVADLMEALDDYPEALAVARTITGRQP